MIICDNPSHGACGKHQRKRDVAALPWCWSSFSRGLLNKFLEELTLRFIHQLFCFAKEKRIRGSVWLSGSPVKSTNVK